MNKQQLSEALAVWDINDPQRNDAMLDAIIAAACLVERLLPGVCEHGESQPHPVLTAVARSSMSYGGMGQTELVPSGECSGRVWDEGIVEVVATALSDPPDRDFARAVLLALGGVL